MPLSIQLFNSITSKFTEEENQQCAEGGWLYSYRRFYTNTATIKPPCSNRIPKHLSYPALVGYMLSYTFDPEERITPCK